VKNSMLVVGYHNDAAATQQSMTDGFFSVGDLARRDASGHFFIEGRKRDMVISGGVNVYPAEVEGVLEQHPDVSEVAVVGVPDIEWGEVVTAVIVARPGRAPLTVEVLREFCRDRLAGFKHPRRVAIVESLPRTAATGQIQRPLLVEQLQQRR
jgi:fatty-acyl-CoA synthase